MDEPGSNFFARTRKRLEKYYYLQDEAEAMNTSIWELAGVDFRYAIINPFDSGDPRRAQFFTERECTIPRPCCHAH